MYCTSHKLLSTVFEIGIYLHYCTNLKLSVINYYEKSMRIQLIKFHEKASPTNKNEFCCLNIFNFGTMDKPTQTA